jgi:hypothetical protein
VICPRPACAVAQQWKPAGSCCTLCKRTTCLDGSTPLPGDCPTQACPVGSICQGFVITPPSGGHFSYGLCCRNTVIG